MICCRNGTNRNISVRKLGKEKLLFKLWLVEKIISGEQTGADWAALDWAISTNIEHGGWCPKVALLKTAVLIRNII
jgi:hypothetical protein